MCVSDVCSAIAQIFHLKSHQFYFDLPSWTAISCRFWHLIKSNQRCVHTDIFYSFRSAFLSLSTSLSLSLSLRRSHKLYLIAPKTTPIREPEAGIKNKSALGKRAGIADALHEKLIFKVIKAFEVKQKIGLNTAQRKWSLIRLWICQVHTKNMFLTLIQVS